MKPENLIQVAAISWQYPVLMVNLEWDPDSLVQLAVDFQD